MSKLLAYETIVKAHEGDPNAVNVVIFDRRCCYEKVCAL